MKFLWFGLGYFVHHFVCVSSILDTIDINIFHDINILGQLSSHAQLIQSNERQLTTIPKLSPKTGLSESCSNKLCLMFESALTCPIMPLSGLNEVCAQYFLGAFLHCPIFPNNLFDAPYTCITEFAGIITKIQGPDPAATLSALFKGFVYGNFTTNCKENCYQQYITRANDFYGNCGTGIQSAPLKTSYPIASILNNFDQFRNQSCAYNPKHENCLSLFTSLSSGGGGIDLFSPTCDFLPGLGITGAQILPVLCDKISPFECCYGTQIALYNQNQLNASAPSIFPACLLRYMSQKCPAVSAASVCGSGGRANISTITGVASIKTSAAYTTLPNMYDTLSVLTLQGVLTAALTTVLPSYNLPLYGLNYTRPLQVEIIDYTYSNATGQVSSTDGAPLVPADADFLAADRGVFTFLFVLENVDSATAVIIQHAINSLLFSAVVQKAGPYSSASVVSTAVPVSVLADPYPTYPSDDDGFDSSVDVGAWLVIAMCGVLLIILALLR